MLQLHFPALMRVFSNYSKGISGIDSAADALEMELEEFHDFVKDAKLETKLATLSDRPIPEAPVFRPTAAQFRDPLRYVASIRREAEPFGICKIVPPRGWKVECAVDWNSTKKFATKRQRSVTASL